MYSLQIRISSATAYKDACVSFLLESTEYVHIILPVARCGMPQTQVCARSHMYNKALRFITIKIFNVECCYVQLHCKMIMHRHTSVYTTAYCKGRITIDFACTKCMQHIIKRSALSNAGHKLWGDLCSVLLLCNQQCMHWVTPSLQRWWKLASRGRRTTVSGCETLRGWGWQCCPAQPQKKPTLTQDPRFLRGEWL